MGPDRTEPTGRLSALVVDDDASDLSILRHALERVASPRIEVHGFTRWEQGLRALGRRSFDVVLLDHGLGVPSERLAELALRGHDVPVVLVTDDEAERAQATLGAGGFAGFASMERLGSDALQRAVVESVELFRLRRELADTRARLDRASRALDARDAEVRALRRSLDRESPGSRTAADPLTGTGLEAAEASLARRSVTLARVVEEAVRHWAPRAQARGVALLWSAEGDTTAWVDPDRIRDVLLGLCGNAVKHTPPAGSVWVRARRDVDGAVRVSVVDTGGGIPVHRQPGLFDRAATRSASSGATGPALPACRALAELHGGRLDVESDAGRGSAFTLTLPPGGPDRSPSPR